MVVPDYWSIGPFAAHARRAYDIYAVGDKRNSLNAVQKFLKHLLQIKAWHAAAERQVPGIAVPRDVAENEFVGTAVNASADSFVNALIISAVCRRFLFHNRNPCHSSRDLYSLLRLVPDDSHGKVIANAAPPLPKAAIC
jgi:hypothetical protein